MEEEYREKMHVLAKVLDEALNGEGCKPEDRKVGFFLTVFPFGEPEHNEGRFNYISNAHSLDVRAACKEVAARIEGRMSSEGRA